MGIEFTAREGSVLYTLLAEQDSDVVFKTDRAGFVLHASPPLARVGLAPPDTLIGPHLLDLVAPSHRAAVAEGHAAALADGQEGPWIEFPARASGGRERWFAVRLRCLAKRGRAAYGVLGVMRCIDERRTLERRLFAAECTDPLTGLTNRAAFIAMLRHLVDRGEHGCLALFDLDALKAINLRHGQSAGDAALTDFADLLRATLRTVDIISRTGGESLGVLLPGVDAAGAATLCQRVLDALTRSGRVGGIPLAASAGIAAIGTCLDDTLRRAELAKFFARASGGGRVELAATGASAQRTAAIPLAFRQPFA